MLRVIRKLTGLRSRVSTVGEEDAPMPKSPTTEKVETVGAAPWCLWEEGEYRRVGWEEGELEGCMDEDIKGRRRSQRWGERSVRGKESQSSRMFKVMV